MSAGGDRRGKVVGMERVVVSLGWDGGRQHVGELNTEFNQHCLFNSESLWWSSEGREE